MHIHDNSEEKKSAGNQSQGQNGSPVALQAKTFAPPAENGGIKMPSLGGSAMPPSHWNGTKVPNLGGSVMPLQRSKQSGVIQRVVFPPTMGNTQIINEIGRRSQNPVAAAEADEVLQDLGGISENRLRVVIMELIRNGNYNNFLTNLINNATATTQSVQDTIASLRTEYNTPTQGTTPATAGEVSNISGILNQGMSVTSTGAIAAFQDDVAGRTFELDITNTLDRVVVSLQPITRRLGQPRFGWPRYEEIAGEAKKRTDMLYGHYAVGSALTATGPMPNLHDVQDQTYNNRDLLGFANYLVTGHTARNPIYPGESIIQKHNADLGRSTESGILRRALVSWMGTGTNRASLLELRRSWSGVQRGGNIYMQRTDMGDQRRNRMQFWRTFKTMIHEYLHKVTHPTFSTAASALGRTKQQIFTEGGTSYFDRNVWQTLVPQEVSSNAQLRETVEGAPYAYDAGVIPSWSGYRQVGQFEQIVNEVGEDNVRAAYFKGEIDRLGMSSL